MRPNNPFLISGYYSPEFFCDRERETETILDALYNGRNLTLMSPRRMGKTGLISHAFYRLSERNADIKTFYLDIYSTQNFQDFVKLFANTVLGQLDDMPQKALARVGRFLKSCRPVMSFDDSGKPTFSIDVVPSAEEATLKEIFEYLASSEKRCYIAIDEFQQIAEYPEKGVEALLRSYIQFLPNVNFIFAGSKQHVLAEMFTSAKKPFYQSTQLMTISAIEKQEYYDFAQSFFAGQGKELPLDVFSYLYDRYEGHTWYIQCVLNRLFSYSQVIDKALIDNIVMQLVSEYGYTYSELIKLYTAGNVRLLKAIASEGFVKEPLAGTFLNKYDLKAASSVNVSLQKLLKNEMVYPSERGYTIYDRLLADWLRNHTY